MVLESLINPVKAEERPALMILFGFLIVCISIFLGLWIFRDYVSLVMVFLTVVGCVPLMYSTMRYEEMKDLSDVSEKTLLKEHSKALMFFIMLFIGFTFGFTAFYVFLPADVVGNVFHVQTETIAAINGRVIEDVAGHAVSRGDIFAKIFFNNLKVLMFCLLFSFFYGAGAIFILTWNASVIGAFIGSFIRANIAKYAGAAGFAKAAGYFQVVLLGFSKVTLHGVPEILAYFVGGLAGGIISVAVIKHDFSTKRFEKIVLDSADLVLIAVFILLVAAILEVWVTPVLF